MLLEILGGCVPLGSPNLSLTKMLFSTPVFRPTIISVSNIHDRGHKRDVHVYIGVNHLRI